MVWGDIRGRDATGEASADRCHSENDVVVIKRPGHATGRGLQGEGGEGGDERRRFDFRYGSIEISVSQFFSSVFECSLIHLSPKPKKKIEHGVTKKFK